MSHYGADGSPSQEPAPGYGAADHGAEPPPPPTYGQDPTGGNPFGQGPDGQNPYGVNPYQSSYGATSPYGPLSYGAVVEPHPRATLALILGIVGVAAIAPVGIAGLVLGAKARRDIDAEPLRYSGRGMATGGFVLGIVSTVFTLLEIFLVLFVVVAVARSGT